MKDKYCHKCGKELIAIELETYNTKTGEKNTRLKCPSDICGHSGVRHEFNNAFVPRCKKCGMILPIP